MRLNFERSAPDARTGSSRAVANMREAMDVITAGTGAGRSRTHEVADIHAIAPVGRSDDILHKSGPGTGRIATDLFPFTPLPCALSCRSSGTLPLGLNRLELILQFARHGCSKAFKSFQPLNEALYLLSYRIVRIRVIQ